MVKVASTHEWKLVPHTSTGVKVPDVEIGLPYEVSKADSQNPGSWDLISDDGVADIMILTVDSADTNSAATGEVYLKFNLPDASLSMASVTGLYKDKLSFDVAVI